jgi:CheY-like chemotaxis protein
MKRVLVVDDEPTVRTLVSLCLKGDCEVETTADGTEALRALNSAPPDLVLLDVGLPGMSGAEVLRQIRENRETASIPVVMLTGREPPEGTKPDGVILKPFTPATLRESVSGWQEKSNPYSRALHCRYLHRVEKRSVAGHEAWIRCTE